MSHEAFPQLPGATELWRYMHLPKFLWVLTKKALYLSQADRLGDAFEGSVPKRYSSAFFERMIAARKEAQEARKEASMPAWNEQEDAAWTGRAI